MTGRWPRIAAGFGYTTSVGVPILIHGRCGARSIVCGHEPISSTAEEHLVDFADLAGTAIANADTKTQLRRLRARVVATADETRRRLQRDLHDGAQATAPPDDHHAQARARRGATGPRR